MAKREPEYRPVWLPTDLHAQLKQLAELDDRTIIAYVKRLVEEKREALRHGNQ